MNNFLEFTKQFSKRCLKKGYEFKSNFNSEFVYSFYLTKKGKKINYTKDFDNTILEDCQKVILSTSNLHITAIDLAKELLKIDNEYLTDEGKKLKAIFKRREKI